ncbi:glycogen debranching N-terminal domain-containing protein [Arthrobacter sp. 2MCAF14]|uniref:glycogen debranching N-terminal domain-containing protein n=1 Tax=Arthrobacter sp. 2MCAF14 TaxID=3232982 RepID=UPI003F8F1210
MAGWNADTAAGPLGAGTVTLVEGSSLCISLANGDMHPEFPHGVFFQDTRILSRWILTINGQPLEPLAAETREPYRALMASRALRPDGHADSPLMVDRLREVGVGIVETITVRNYSVTPANCLVSLSIASDFADLFEVKEARITRRWEEARRFEGGSLTIMANWQDQTKGVVISGEGAVATSDGLTYRTVIDPQGQQTRVVRAVPITDSARPEPLLDHVRSEGRRRVTCGAGNG